MYLWCQHVTCSSAQQNGKFRKIGPPLCKGTLGRRKSRARKPELVEPFLTWCLTPFCDQGDTSGDYRKILLKICGGNDWAVAGGSPGPPAGNSNARKRPKGCLSVSNKSTKPPPGVTVQTSRRAVAPAPPPPSWSVHCACAKPRQSLRMPPAHPHPSQPLAAKVDVLFPDSCSHSPLLMAETLGFLLAM